MSSDLNAALLFRLNLNINDLGSAIEEIGIWIEQRSSTDSSKRIAKTRADVFVAMMVDDGMDKDPYGPQKPIPIFDIHSIRAETEEQFNPWARSTLALAGFAVVAEPCS